MRKPSVVNSLREELVAHDVARSSEECVADAWALGQEAIAAYAAAHGVGRRRAASGAGDHRGDASGGAQAVEGGGHPAMTTSALATVVSLAGGRGSRGRASSPILRRLSGSAG